MVYVNVELLVCPLVTLDILVLLLQGYFIYGIVY